MPQQVQGQTNGGRQMQVKFVKVCARPELMPVPEGTTVGQFLTAHGHGGWEVSIGTEICRDMNRPLKDGDAIILKQRLQAGNK